MYATCTIFKEINNLVCTAFLADALIECAIDK